MNDKTVTVVATFQARPGKESELRAALLGLLAPTRKEAGCLNYDLHQAPDDPARFLFHENWTTKAALDAHLQSPHLKAFVPRVDELCTAFPEIKIWERIG
jgi:quinol monooxygenase YgiN